MQDFETVGKFCDILTILSGGAVNNQIAMEVEQKLRKFVSEILNPFNDRICTLNKDVRSLQQKIVHHDTNLQTIECQITSLNAAKDQVNKLSGDIQTMVSNNLFIIVCFLECRNRKSATKQQRSRAVQKSRRSWSNRSSSSSRRNRRITWRLRRAKTR